MFRIVLLTFALLTSPALAAAQQPAEQHGVTTPGHVAGGSAGGEPGPAEAAAHAEGAVHEETIWGPISRAFNSAVLFGVLYYFLRKPIASYLSSRDREIRNDLVTAAEMKKTATAQLAELDRKMAALPGELELLKARGQEEIAAEEARIEQAAAAERERLIEQTRREIDLQLRIAQRELVEQAANLAVGLATDRIRKNITPDDQTRLVDRYLQQVKG
jgi:F-type H+-transporting ATPase subunit b